MEQNKKKRLTDYAQFAQNWQQGL